MNLDDESRTRLLVTVSLDVDPAGSTLELKVDDTWHACVWQGSAVHAGDQWTQTGRTTDYFGGPNSAATVGEMLTVGRHATETRVTWAGGDTIVAASSPIDVK